MFDRSAHLYDALYSFKDYEAEAARVTELVELHRPGASSLLDVACGTGKHLEHLRRSYEVEGLDLDPELVRIARDRLGAVTVHEGDMTTFDLGRTYDVVTCLFSSIGYLRDVDALEAAFARFRAHLNGGGLAIVEPWFYPESYIPGFVHTIEADLPKGRVVRMGASRRRGDLSELEFHYLVGQTDGSIEHFTETHVLRLFARATYERALGSAGLEVVEYDPDGLIGRGLFVSRAP